MFEKLKPVKPNTHAGHIMLHFWDAWFGHTKCNLWENHCNLFPSGFSLGLFRYKICSYMISVHCKCFLTKYPRVDLLPRGTEVPLVDHVDVCWVLLIVGNSKIYVKMERALGWPQIILDDAKWLGISKWGNNNNRQECFDPIINIYILMMYA